MRDEPDIQALARRVRATVRESERDASRLERLEKKVDALFAAVNVLGFALLVTLIALGVIAARLGL